MYLLNFINILAIHQYLLYTFIINLYKYLLKVWEVVSYMKKMPASPQAMKKVNITLIKKVLKNSASATKAEISEATGISSTTVRSLINELLENKEIVSMGLDQSSGGRRAERYTLNFKNNFILAFYIGSNYIDYVIINPLDKVIEDNRIEISIDKPIDAIDNFIGSILKSNTGIKMIGISASGIVDKGTYITGRKFDELKKFNIGEYIENKYSIPVVLENDLNSMAVGFSLSLMEKFDIRSDDMNVLNIIYIQFTTKGVGAGIIANGKLVRGISNFAGELGFMPISSGLNLDYVLDNNLNDETYADIIARVIAIVNCVTNPGFVIIGGDIFKFHLVDQIKESCKKYIKKSLMPDILCDKDSRKHCLTGITHLAMESMYSGINLIDNSNDSK